MGDVGNEIDIVGLLCHGKPCPKCDGKLVIHNPIHHGRGVQVSDKVERLDIGCDGPEMHTFFQALVASGKLDKAGTN